MGFCAPRSRVAGEYGTCHRSGVIEACFHSASEQDSDPSPTLSASVINPTKTHKHTPLDIQAQPAPAINPLPPCYTAKNTHTQLVNKVPAYIPLLTIDVTMVTRLMWCLCVSVTECVLPVAAGRDSSGFPGDCGHHETAQAGGVDLDERGQEWPLRRTT